MIEFLTTYKSIIVVLHALVAAVGLGAVVITDTLFFQYLKDFKISKKEEETTKVLSQVIWVAIGALFVTGAALFLSAPLDYVAKSKFIVKVVIFAVIVGNGIVLNMVIAPIMRKISFGPVDRQPGMKMRIIRRVAFASGAISMISWIIVFILGSVRSIPMSTPQGIIGYLILVAIVVLGSQGYATWVKYQTILPPRD